MGGWAGGMGEGVWLLCEMMEELIFRTDLPQLMEGIGEKGGW